MASQYADRIKAILKSSDPNVVTAKRIRKQLEEEYGLDLTPMKRDVDALVLRLFEESGDENGTSNAVDSVTATSINHGSATNKSSAASKGKSTTTSAMTRVKSEVMRKCK